MAFQSSPTSPNTWRASIGSSAPRQSLYGRYFLDDYHLAAFFDPHDILVTSVSGNDERAQTFVLGHTFTINPSTINSFHFTVRTAA